MFVQKKASESQEGRWDLKSNTRPFHAWMISDTSWYLSEHQFPLLKSGDDISMGWWAGH